MRAKKICVHGFSASAFGPLYVTPKEYQSISAAGNSLGMKLRKVSFGAEMWQGTGPNPNIWYKAHLETDPCPKGWMRSAS